MLCSADDFYFVLVSGPLMYTDGIEELRSHVSLSFRT